MRLLFINSEFPPIGGGAGSASAFLSAALVNQGQEVIMLTSRFANLPHRENQQGVDVIRIPALRRRADRSGALEQIIFVGSSVLHARGLAHRWRPDAVIAFFGVPSGPAAWLLDRLYGIPYIVSLRGGDVPGFRPYDFGTYHRLIGPFLKIIWRGAVAVVANSQGLLRLAKEFMPAQDVQVIPNGVDASVFPCLQRNWDPPKLLFTGRLVYQKGLDTLLEALGGLKELPWQLTLVGDGPQHVPLEQQARELGLEERIIFAGWQPRQVLPKLYQEANLFVLPSRHEGMPNALLEAMSSGLPAIASCIAGNEELVQDGQTGLLFPPGDVASLRDALRILLTDTSRRTSMGRAARLRVEKDFSWDRVADAYLGLLSPLEDKG